MKLAVNILFFLFLPLIATAQYVNGNQLNGEMGDAFYRNGAADHGHAGVFVGLEKWSANFTLNWLEILGYDGLVSGGENYHGYSPETTFNLNNISTADWFTFLKKKFQQKDTNLFYGTFNNPPLSFNPNTSTFAPPTCNFR